MHQKDLFNEKNIFLTFKAAGDWKKLFKVIQVYRKRCVEINKVQCNLDLVTILQRQFFNLLHKINLFSDIMQFNDSFCGDQKCH